jgi:hypothetical protein
LKPVDRCAPRSSIHEADATLVGGRADPTANSCTGNCDEALRKKCSETEWFSHRGGTRRLHATYYEASMGIYMKESGRNCQAPGHLGKNSQSQFASHRLCLCRWLFVLQPRSARILAVRSKARTREAAARRRSPPPLRHSPRLAIAALSHAGHRTNA